MALISVTISGNAAPLKKSVDEAEGALGKFGSSIGKMGKIAAVGFAAAGAAAGAFAVSAIRGAEAARVADDRLAQVNKSMNLFGESTAAVTSRLQKLADAQEFELGVTAETIKATQAKLLTFAELGKSADELGGQFDRATVAAVDLAAAGFGNAETNAVQLGKALQDPIKGITALAKSGVTFTETEKDRIAVLVESNKIGEAQELVLAAIEKQVGGTAAATATSSFKIGAAFGHIKDAVGDVLLPVMDNLAKFIVEKLIPFFNQISEKFGPKLQEAFAAISAFVTDRLVPAVRDRLLPILQRVAEFIQDRLVPVIRDVAIKVFDGLRNIFEKVSEKIEENSGNIEKMRGFFSDLIKFVTTYVAPTLTKVLSVAFDVVGEAIGPVIDVVFRLMGALASLGSFVLKIAGFLVKTFESAINGVIDIVNFAIRQANKINPFGRIDEIGNISISSGFGAAPTAPAAPGGVTSGPDLLERRLGGLTPAAAGIGIPDLGLDDEEEDGGAGGRGGGKKGGTVAILPVDMTGQIGIIGSTDIIGGGGAGVGAAIGTEALLDGMTGGISITVNTVSADANLPNLIVDALQQYNLVSGPIDVTIAA